MHAAWILITQFFATHPLCHLSLRSREKTHKKIGERRRIRAPKKS